jgi:hypothetical protein
MGQGSPSPMMPTKPPNDDAVTDDARRARWRLNSKRYRKRRQRGLWRRTVSVEEHQLDSLENLGYLDPDSRGDPVDESVAIEAFMADQL